MYSDAPRTIKALIMTATVLYGLLFTLNGWALSVGETSPNLFGRTLDNKLFRLSDEDGPRVVNFFWVECKPCRKELPELAHLAERHRGVKFITVHVEEEEKEAVMAFINNLPAAPKTVVLASPMVKDTFGVVGLPYTVVIDGNGVVKATITGYTEKGMAKLKSVLQEL